ncbi:hypothetical protein CIL03_05645 [Virgibacillus indicus]|uniref:Competence protein CoiA n=1 Tax=Virgibacillus indicus TaxID=2024554 RepID=A0A265NFM2_9BACI|nr:competence protein CoiA family protein [Virgibacillus indicus]OZU90621.1 hypothetical protein CIL03_05645 [Virgibacillus indicus]
MLQAKTLEGKLMTLAILTREELKKLKQENKLFFCPTCSQQVIIKAGLQMIPHFAHKSIIDCPSAEGGEGAYHEQGKLLLYQWFRAQGITVQLEAFLPEINQRPDLLLTLNNKRIVVEYQCARIPVELIQQRNEGYKSAGITPIWILGANRLKRQTGNHFKADQFTLQFLHKFSTKYPLILYYFCPETLQFITIQDSYLTKIGQAAGKINAAKLNMIGFTDIFKQQSFDPDEIYQLWKKEKRQFRLKARKHLFGSELAWHQWLYLKGTHLEYLPSIIHLPNASAHWMKTPGWNWQSRLCLDVIDKLSAGSSFSLKTCEYHLRKQIHNPQYFPLILSAENPIENYLRQLCQLGIIEQLSDHTYQKQKNLTFYNSIEEALKGDDQLMNALQNKIEA